MKLACLLSFICCTFIPLLAIADPAINSVSGTLDDEGSIVIIDGGSIVINGSGYGTRSKVAPLVFENFDTNDSGRSHGNTLQGKNSSHFGSWTTDTRDTMPTYSSNNNRKGSSLCGYFPLVANNTDANHAPGYIEFSDSHQPTILLSLWIRYTYTNWSGGGNVKIYRINDGTGDADTQISIHCGSGNQNPERGFFTLLADDDTRWPSEGDSTLNFTFSNDGVWQHHLIFLKSSRNNVADGSAIIWIDGNKLEDTNSMETWSSSDSWQRFTMGWYVANYSGGNFDIYADDIYIDNTWQSVYIGNKPTWNECTHREIQLPTSWRDDRIEITCNQGSFGANDEAYIFVIDQNGIPSNGLHVGKKMVMDFKKEQ